MAASLIASLLLRSKRRVPDAPSAPSLRSSHDGVAHCFASLTWQTAGACGAVSSFASFVTRRRRSLLRFSCVASGVCRWRRQSLRFASHMTALLIASLPLRCKRRVPVALSAPFASLVTWRRCSLLRSLASLTARSHSATMPSTSKASSSAYLAAPPLSRFLTSDGNGKSSAFAVLSFEDVDVNSA